MDVNQISTDLMNLAGLAEEEQRQLKDALEKKKNVPAIIMEDKAGLELSISQITEEPIRAARDMETKNESRRMTTDEAKRAILEKYRAKRNSPHSIPASPYSPPSPKKKKSDAGKLLYASSAPNVTKRKSWFGKRKKGKSMKPLKKLSKETRMAILNMGKLNGSRAKTVVTEEETAIPTVIQLKEATKTPSRLPNSTEMDDDVARNVSFSDSVSTLSHHAHGEGIWAELGMSSLLNSVLSVGRGKTDKRSALNEHEPKNKAIKGKDKTGDPEIFGWKSFVDKKTGHTYYQDPITKETTWTSPTTKIQTPTSPTSSPSNANAATKGAIDTSTETAAYANVMRLPHIVDAEKRGDEESGTMSGTECSENVTKLPQGDGETYDDTIGSFSTSRDVSWLELGMSKVLDVSFSVKSDMDVYVEEDEGAADAALEVLESESSKAQPDTEAENRQDRSTKTTSVLETVQSAPSLSCEKGPCTSSTSVVNSTEQAESCEKRPSTKANVDKTESLDSTPADSGWFDQGVSSMLSFAGLMAQDQNNVNLESATKEPMDDERNRNASAPKTTETFPSIHLVSSIDSPDPAIPSDPSWVKVAGNSRLLPSNDVKEEDTQDKMNESGDTLLSDPFKALNDDCEENEKEAENEKNVGPGAEYHVGRTLSGLTGITGASVFSGISDDISSRVLEASTKSTPSTEDEEFLIKPERQLDAIVKDASKASNKESHAAPASSRGPIDNGDFGLEDQFKDKTICMGTKKAKPPLWKAVFEPSTGRTYYFNRLTREATWTKPSDFKENRKPDVYWGPAHKGSIAVREAIASTANERLVASKKGTDEDVTETTDADPALLRDKSVLDESDTSFEAPTLQDVDVVEYKSYDPVVALKIQHFHTRKAKSSPADDQAQPVATEENVVVSKGYTNDAVADASPSNPSAEENNDKPVLTRPDIFSKERDNLEQARNDPVLNEKKTKRKLLSWRRKRTAIGEKATAIDCAEEDAVEDSVLAPELIAGVEKGVDLNEAIDYSCISESGIVEVSNVTTSEDVDNELGGESGFERVLSSVGKKKPTVSISEENSSVNDVEKNEDVVSNELDKDVVVASASKEPTRKGPLQLLKSSSQKMLSSKGKERSEEEAAALNKSKDAETPPTISTKPKRKGLFQRLKSKSPKKLVDTKTSDGKDVENESSLEAKVATKTEVEASESTVCAEVTTECEQAGGKGDVGLARSPPIKKNISLKTRNINDNTDGKSRKNMVAAAKVKAKEAEPNQAKKVVATPEKGASPASVLKFIKVGDEALESKPQLPVWKSAVDPATGRTYYYHRITRQTTWTKPDDYDDSTGVSTDDSKEQGSSDRDSVRCKLDDKFAAASEDMKFEVRSVRPKQTNSKIQKAEPRADETTKKSISASGIRVLGLSTNLALLEQVVEDPFKATGLVRGELEKVAQLFQPKESTSPENKTGPSIVDAATKLSVKNSSNESCDYPDDESSGISPRDERIGSLNAKKEAKQGPVVVTKPTTAETSTAQHDKSTKVRSSKVEKVWEDLLFL